MSFRIEEHDEEYRDAVFNGMMFAIVFHALVIFVGGAVVSNLTSDSSSERRLELGYEGPRRILDELEILEPNSVQSYFYQKRRIGQMRAPEYQIVEPLKLDPGPDPVPVRQPEKKPEPQLSELLEDVELIEPLKPRHKELSFSQDFTILKGEKPDYPEYENSRAIEARVVVQCYVNPEGNIEDALIASITTDPSSASPRAFELAVLEAVRQWKIVPPIQSGQPQGIWIKIPFDFIQDERPTP